jgi:hypothetical protein
MNLPQFTFNTGASRLMFIKLPKGSYDIVIDKGELKASFLTEVSGIPVAEHISVKMPMFAKLIGTMDVLQNDDDKVEPYVQTEVIDHKSQSLRNVYGSDKFIEYKNYREEIGTWMYPSQSFCSIFDRKIKGKPDDWGSLKECGDQWVAISYVDLH